LISGPFTTWNVARLQGTVALLFAILLGASTIGSASPSADPKVSQKVPNVLILVISGVLPTGADGISFTYDAEVPESAVKADLKAILGASGWNAKAFRVTTQQGRTSAEFQVDGAVKWDRGIILVEPFAIAFKRFSLIQVSYLLPGSFPSHSLKDYSDKYVDIKYEVKGNSYTYAINVKDHSFNKLNLPIIIASADQTKPESAARKSGGGGRVLIALLLALAAGAIVYFFISRASRK
jgi:hypothetical protein